MGKHSIRWDYWRRLYVFYTLYYANPSDAKDVLSFILRFLYKKKRKYFYFNFIQKKAEKG
jgi:hypothetical protein